MDMEIKENARQSVPSVKFQEGARRRETDEFVLVDLWALVARRKKIVLAFFLVTTLGATAWGFLSPFIYESRAVVQVGQLSSAQSTLESPDDVVERLKEEYRLNDASEGDQQFPLVNAIKAAKGAKNIIIITARGYSAREAHDFLTNVINKLLSEHDARHKRVRELIEERLQAVRNRIIETDNQIKILNKQIVLQNEKNAIAAGILTMEQSVLLQHSTALEKYESQLAMDIHELDMRPTQIFREATLPISPIRPKRSLYIVIGIVSGLMLGVLAAFAAEFTFFNKKGSSGALTD